MVGVDGSRASTAGLHWARDYAEATGAAVRAVRAWHYPAGFGPAPLGKAPDLVNDEVKQQMNDELAADIAQVYDGQPAQVEAKSAYGHPAEVLLGESENAGPLVVGHRGHSSFTSVLLGSVSLHCVAAASCPVVVVRAG